MTTKRIARLTNTDFRMINAIARDLRLDLRYDADLHSWALSTSDARMMIAHLLDN